MRRECYLCHRDMGHAGDDPPGWPGPGESVTHWLCDECLPLERARWARHASVHWNEHGCQEWVMHAFAYQLACGDYVIERDGKRLGRYARDNVLAQAVRFGLDPIDVWGRDPETGLVIWDVIALGMTNVRPR